MAGKTISDRENRRVMRQNEVLTTCHRDKIIVLSILVERMENDEETLS
jgi:hypothetical protein